jgi:hypothetical protein
LQPSVTPAAVSVSNGSSSAAACSSAGVGLRASHRTSRSVTSDGSTSSFARVIKRAMSSSTVCDKSTPFSAAYRASATSVRFTHIVTGAPACDATAT